MVWDILIIAVLVLSSVIAFFRGFVREVLTILAVVGAGAAAYVYGDDARPVFRNLLGVGEGEEAQEKKIFDLIPYELVADGLAYGLIFLTVVIFLSILSHYIAVWTRKSGLGLIDRTIGVLFGVMRGVLLLALFYMFIHISVEPEVKKRWFEGSRGMVYIELTSDWLMTFFPQVEKPERILDDDQSVDKALSINPLRDLVIDHDDEGTLTDKKDSPEKDPDSGEADEGIFKDGKSSSGVGYKKEMRKEMDELLTDQPDD